MRLACVTCPSSSLNWRSRANVGAKRVEIIGVDLWDQIDAIEGRAVGRDLFESGDVAELG